MVLTVFLLVALCAVVALAVDLGYLCTVDTELQRSADAAALAAAAALYPIDGSLQSGWYHVAPDPDAARLEAQQFVAANRAAGREVGVDLNLSNALSGDIVVGRLNSPPDQTETLDTAFDPPNTVQVTIPLSATHGNGPVGLFFARVLGVGGSRASATSAATIWYPALLPFATSQGNWDSRLSGGAGDHYAYEPGHDDFGVVQGSDGLPEVVMFPGPWNGAGLPPGNFGLLQIGPGGGELTSVRRQIDTGPSVNDMQQHGGSLSAGDHVPGRCGLKSASKTAFLGGLADSRDFAGIIGRPRQLPLYESVTGNGDNAVFVLSGFVAVRVMALKIDNRWRTSYRDVDGNDITGIMVQPLRDAEELVQLQLTR